MRKFLTILALFLIPFILILYIEHLGPEKEQIEKQEKDTRRKKMVVISTEEHEVMGRIIHQTSRGVIFSDWMSATNAVEEREKIVENSPNREFELFIQYDKYPY